jgi:hypothetical protein
MALTRNEGVIVNGGSFNATNAAIGRNSQVNQIQLGGADAMNQAQKQMDLVLRLLQEHAALVPNHEEVTEAAQSVKNEITKEKPNRLTLKSLLEGIASSVKSVSTLAVAVEALKTAVSVLVK